LGFSPEGAAIYLGTDTGKILVIDLRALDKPPKTITVSESCSRIQTISVQVRY
jgi:protein NEDD1